MRAISTPVVLLFCLIAVAHVVMGQIDTNCVGTMRGILTVPGSGSANPEIPSKRNVSIFDWTASAYNVHSTRIPNATSIASPFYQGASNDQVYHFLNNKDMRPQDGWELIKMELGYNDDGTQKSTAANFVYLFLYNKYTAILRVFFAGGTEDQYNGAQITIGFIDGEHMSSVLSAGTDLYALDKNETKRSFGSLVPYNADGYKWFYADFNMGYDPCTCVFESAITVKLRLISEAEVNVNGTVNATIATIDGDPSDEVDSDQHYSFHDVNEGAQKTVEVFNSMSDFKETLYSSLGETSGSDSNVENFVSTVKSSSFLKAGLSAIPYVGAALELIDLFTGGGRESSGPQQVEVLPMALDGTINLSGTITTTTPYSTIQFYTPGSKNSESLDISSYPYYNEILGVFNIIETPKIHQFVSSIHYTSPPTTYDYDHVIFQLQPPADGTSLSYVLNPAARFNGSKVEILGKLQYGYITGASAPVFHVFYETEYMSMAGLHNMSINSGVQTITDLQGIHKTVFGMSEYLPSAVRLQLLVNLERLDATANTQNVLMKLTYPVDVITDTNVNFYDKPSYASIPATRTYSNTAIASGTYTALQSITTGTSVTNGSGAVITLRSPQVVLGAGTHFTATSTSTVTISGDHALAGALIIPAAATNTVKAFCASSTYTNNHPEARIASDFADTEIPLDERTFRLSPNPATNVTNIYYSVDAETNAEILVRDVTGRLIHKMNQGRVSKGEYNVRLETFSLPSGLYFFSLRTDKETKTEKLIIQR